MENQPDYGPLGIHNYQTFLEKCKEEFNKSLSTPIGQTGSLSNFTVIRHLGKGAFGIVYLVKRTNTETYQAMKTIEKATLVKKGLLKNAKNEKTLLHLVHFPFLIRLDCYFMDNSFVYFVMPLIAGGELFYHLQRAGRFDEHLVRFYSAQVALGLEYLHFLDIIYRDLKPENILVDHTGYVKLADLGFAKIVKTRTYTVCGTPEYIAPEIIVEKGYSKAVDWWSFGILLYEMASGHTPFYNKNHMKIYEFAVSLKYRVPKFFSPELRHIIKCILQTDLSKRLGNLSGGAKDVKEHKFFRPILWSYLLNRGMTPPFIPDKEALLNVETSSESIILEIENKDLFEKEFRDF